MIKMSLKAGEKFIVLLLIIFPMLSLGARRDQSYYANRWTAAKNDQGEQTLKSSVKFIARDPPAEILPPENSNFVPEFRVTNDGKMSSEISNEISDKEWISSSDERDKRIFYKGFQDLFSKFIFVKNDSCVSPTGDNGTCYKETDCTKQGGMGSGACGLNGIGICCVFIKSCGDSSNQNVTYFVSSGYPNSFDATGSCQMYISKVNTNICQLRLDFIDFTLSGPNSTSTICSNDRFTVSGATTSIPTTCGVNTGNHMYIHLGPGITTPTTLSFITMGGSFQRKWKVKVSQIPCNKDFTAPSNCLQYFTGITGKIKTYNFDFEGGGQLANQDYTTCLRTERGFCGIQYTPCTDPGATTGVTAIQPRSFTLTGSPSGPGSQQDASSCSTDYVIIPCASASITSGTSSCFDRFCGSLLNIAATGSPTVGNAAAYTYVKPFQIIYHTDNSEATGETSNKGYCLNYVEQPCT